MGFYLRKAFRFGPVRFNLSKSGIGTSFGVTGARIGVNSRGRAYVHAGRGGFYFRETLSPPASPRRGRVDAPAVGSEEPIRYIESGVSSSLTDAGQASFVAELSRVYKRKSHLAIAGICGIVLVLGLLVALQPETGAGWLVVLLAVGAVAVALRLAHKSDERDGTVRLTFDLVDDAEQRYSDLRNALTRLAACQRVWAVETEQQTGDWKRNAGATSLVRRTRVEPSSQLPKGVETNQEILCLPAGKQKLYFFPKHSSSTTGMEWAHSRTKN